MIPCLEKSRNKIGRCEKPPEHPHNSVVPANVMAADRTGGVMTGLEGVTVRLAFPMEPYVVDELRNIFTPGKTPVIEKRTSTKMMRIRHTKRNGVAAPASATPLSPPQRLDQNSTEVGNTTFIETRTPRNLLLKRYVLSQGRKLRNQTSGCHDDLKREWHPHSSLYGFILTDGMILYHA